MVIRKRLLFWLVKAYIKKWGKYFIFFFIIGLFVFFGILKTLQWLVPKIPVGKSESIGLIGAYHIQNLPPIVQEDIARGLTKVSAEGDILPAVAKSWDVRDDGKTYVFKINPDLTFSDKSPITSNSITYSFADVAIEHPDKTTIIFKLKDKYSPFLVTVARPFYKKGFIGAGDYSIKNVDLNGSFVESITLASVKNQYDTRTYHFYPSSDSLKLAYVLGEVQKAYGITNDSFKNTSLSSFKNTDITVRTNYSQMVALFYNTKDPVVSDKKIRTALSYAVKDTMPYGERSFSPYPTKNWVYTNLYSKTNNVQKAKELLSESNSASSGATLTFNIKTLPKYETVAKDIAKNWQEIGVKTSIELVDSIPSTFQIFLGDFSVPKDPDQYTLWHSDQNNNITGYKNLRIDKYLEDGRKIVDRQARKELYIDFQKYLLDDSPATFLYFPYEYELVRKS